MQHGFHFDGTRCTGCKTCMLACKDYCDLPPDTAYRQVYEYVGGSWSRGSDGLWTQDCFAYYVSVACNHCAEAACMKVCPTAAMHKDENSLVVVDTRRCIGCGYCAMACPYHVPKVNREAGHSVKCDGCASRVAEGKAPVCVEACPLRALDFGDIEELRAKFGGLNEVAPLPPACGTRPNLVITPPRGVRSPESRDGRVANMRELV